MTDKISKKRRVFVTGGAHGIGRAIVEAFCKKGDIVAFCDIDEKLGQETADRCGAEFYKVDVSDKDMLEDAMKSVFEAWGDIDILVNNVGLSAFSPLTETSVDEFDRIIAVNLRSVFVTSRLWAIHRKNMYGENQRRYGRIVNMCSTRYQQSESGTEAYSASKGGIWSLTHALAVSLAPAGITVNCIAPGWIHVNENETIRPEDEAFHLSGRVGAPEDIARTCMFLCEEGNDFINGQCITVDGGVSRTMIYPE